MKLIKVLIKLSIVSFFVYGCASSDVDKDPQNLDAQPIPDASSKIMPSTVSEANVAEMNRKSNKENIRPIDAKSVDSGKLTKLGEAIYSGNESKIREATSELLIQNPKDIAALNALGLLYYQKGNYEAALYLYNKALQAQPNSPDIYNNVGLAKMALNEQREAIVAYRKGLELNASHPAICANLGTIYLKNHEYIKAEILLEKVYNAGTKDINVLNNYALVLMAKNENSKAEDILEKLYKNNSGNANIMFNYASLLIEKLNKPKDGLDILNRLKFVGVPLEMRNMIKDLESEAKAGLK